MRLAAFILLAVILFSGAGLNSYSQAGVSASAGPGGYEGGADIADLCVADVFVELVSGEYAGLYFVEGPANLTLREYYRVNGSTVFLDLNLLLVPSPGVEDRVIVKEVAWSAEGFDRTLVVHVEGVLEVPEGSIAVSVRYFVAGNIYVDARELGDGRLAVRLTLEDLRLNLVSGLSLTGLGIPERLQYLNLSYILDPGKGRAYMVDENGETQVIGEGLPFFPYPEAFSPYLLVKELYMGALGSLERLARDPKPLEILAGKVKLAESAEQKIKLVSDFTSAVFEESRPGFTYLGYTSKYKVAEAGPGGVSVAIVSREPQEGQAPLVLRRSGSEDPSKLVEALKGGGEEMIREFLEGFFTLREPEAGNGSGAPVYMKFSGPLAFRPASQVLLPLPPGNPLKAKYISIFAGPKVIPCNVLDLVREEINSTGYTIDEVEYNVVGDMLEIVDKSTGEVIHIANYSFTSINGTDGIVYTGSEDIIELYRQSMDAWRLNGYKVIVAFNEVWNFLYRVFWDAAAQGPGNVDLEAKMGELKAVMDRALAEPWPRDPFAPRANTTSPPYEGSTPTEGPGEASPTAPGSPSPPGRLAPAELVLPALLVVVAAAAVLAYYLRRRGA